MTPARLIKLQKELGLSGKHLAKIFGVSDSAISRYKRGQMELSRTSDFMMRMKAFAALSPEERARHLQNVLGDDADYQRMLLRETGKVARALVEQYELEPMKAFEVAHCGHHNFPWNFDLLDMAVAYKNAAGQVSKISKTEFEKMLKLHSERNREEQ